jgi:hypothetical protein
VKVESSGSSAGGTGQFYLNPAYSTTPVGAGGEGQLYETLDGAGTASVGHAGMAMASSAVRGGAVGGGQAAVVSAVGAAVPTQRATVLHVGGDDYDNVGRDAPQWPLSEYETPEGAAAMVKPPYDLGGSAGAADPIYSVAATVPEGSGRTYDVASEGFGFGPDGDVYASAGQLGLSPIYDMGADGPAADGPVYELGSAPAPPASADPDYDMAASLS